MAHSYRRGLVVASTLGGALWLAGCYSTPPEVEAELAALRQTNQDQRAAIALVRSESQTALQGRDATIADLRSTSQAGIQERDGTIAALQGRIASAEGYRYLDTLLAQAQTPPQGASDEEQARRLAYLPHFQTAVSRYREIDQAIAAITSNQQDLAQKKALDPTTYFQSAAGSLAEEFPRAWAAQSRRYDELLLVGRALQGAYGRAIARIRDYMTGPSAAFDAFNESPDAEAIRLLERIAQVYVPDSARHLAVSQRMRDLELVLHESTLGPDWMQDDALWDLRLEVQGLSARSPYGADWDTMCPDESCLDASPTGSIFRWIPAGASDRRAAEQLGTIAEIDALFPQ